jgi:hypothetical protein
MARKETDGVKREKEEKGTAASSRGDVVALPA